MEKVYIEAYMKSKGRKWIIADISYYKDENSSTKNINNVKILITDELKNIKLKEHINLVCNIDFVFNRFVLPTNEEVFLYPLKNEDFIIQKQQHHHFEDLPF